MNWDFVLVVYGRALAFGILYLYELLRAASGRLILSFATTVSNLLRPIRAIRFP